MLNLVAPVNWILVTEQLPTNGKLVLVEITGPVVRSVVWFGRLENLDHWSLIGGGGSSSVTAWADLPLSPAEILREPAAAANPLLPKPTCPICGCSPRTPSVCFTCQHSFEPRSLAHG